MLPKKPKLKSHPRPVIVSTNPVRRRTAGRLSKPLLWQGRQWAVTGYGVEARDLTYPIRKTELWQCNEGHGWLEHMAEKNWVDMQDFLAALAWARNYYASLQPRGEEQRQPGNKRSGGLTPSLSMPTVEQMLA